MTKAEFILHCQTSTQPLSLSIGPGAVGLGAEVSIYLNGAWCRNAIVQRSVYRPWPGRQWKHFQLTGITARAVCERHLPKYARWLQEWQATQLRTNARKRSTQGTP